MQVIGATAEEKDGGYVIRASVRNAGSVDTEDVVQLYVQNEGSANAPRNPRLCGFKRVKLAAGETQEVVIPVAAERLLVVNDDGEFVSEGAPVLYAGVSQPDPLSEKLTGHKCVKIVL